MTTKILTSAGLLVAGVVVGWLLFAPSSVLGGVYNQVSNHFTGGLYAGDADEFSVNSTGGTAALTTSDSATSTFTVGCIQMPATSTATAYKLVIGSSVYSTSTFGAGTGVYQVWAVRGTCPNL